jgi:phosphatidylserine/phosphatidylglycerophosphate/cardiolipin synthase-like enzyme
MINLIRTLLVGEKVQNEQTTSSQSTDSSYGQVVVSLPPEIRAEFMQRLPSAIATYDAFKSLFGQAKESIKIFSPFVDPTFTALVQPTSCHVNVITTIDDKKGFKGNSCLERCATHKDILVRYIVQRKSKMQMFQIHAKLILVDRNIAYVGSANLTDTSLHYNLELGLLIREDSLISDLNRMFDYMFENVAVPSELL